MASGNAVGIRDGVLQAADVAAQLPYERWFFGEAMSLDGLVLAGEAFGSSSMFALARDIVEPWVAELSGRAARDSDLDAPVRALLSLARAPATEAAGDLDYVGAARKVANHLVARPTAGGAMLHGLQGYDNDMVFVDYIYYAGPYLALLSAVCGPEYMEAAARQTLAHVALLRDPGSDLFHHCFDPERGETNGIAWGRGNGWAMLGLVDTLELLPSEHPARGELERVCLAQMRACVRLQHDSGHWHTILDDPESPLEPSIAAFMVTALAKARGLGLAGDAVVAAIARAWNATRDALHSGGRFPTSMTEWPSWEASDYYARPSGVNTWGQGIYLRACAQMQNTNTGGIDEDH